MEPWSDLPVIENFRIKFFLDTNILTYLIDQTYSGLLSTINYLNTSEFADLSSSNYVIFEFVGVRKREHYLREVIAHTTAGGQQLNVSSLLKYKDDFSAPEVPFEGVKAKIQTSVEQELNDIIINYGINYSKNILHDDLLFPTFDINLFSKISKEDSLVLVTSVWPDTLKKEDFVLLVSNDEQFVSAYNNSDISSICAKHSICKPKMEHMRTVKLQNNTKVNLTDPNDDHKLNTFWPQKLKELIIEKNSNLFLGLTIPCGNGPGFPKDTICFQLKENTILNKDVFLTIIGKDLDFIYTTRMSITDFWEQKSIKSYPYQSINATNISFKIADTDVTGAPTPLDPAITSRLRETGNLVFVNPDS